MALNWNWDEKCGEITVRQQNKDGNEEEYNVSLYRGNAFLIMLYEYVGDDGTDMYNLFGFFADKEHAKNCLGLNPKKGYDENIYNRENGRFTKVRLNKSKYDYTKELVEMLVKAFDNITIEIYSEA